MHQYLLFTLTLLFLFACNKEDDGPINPVDQLPPATQTGVGMMACLIDGEPWVNSPDGLGFQGIQTSVLGPPRPGIYILGDYDPDRTGENSQAVTLRLFPVEEGRISIDTANCTYILNTPSSRDYLNPRSESDDEIIIDFLDPDARIVSGKFNLTVYKEGSTTPVTLSDGRFDVTF